MLGTPTPTATLAFASIPAPAVATTAPPLPTLSPAPRTPSLTAAPTATLPSSGIVGTARDERDAPVPRLAVNALAASPCCTTVGVTQTAADGTYVIALAPGTYKVVFFGTSADEPWVQQWWNARTTYSAADVVTVPAGLVRLDARMAKGGAIEGRISDASTGASVTPATIAVYDASAPCCATRLSATGARGDGTYSVIVPAAPIWVLFTAAGYVTQYWQGSTSEAQATPLTVQGLKKIDVKLTRK